MLAAVAGPKMVAAQGGVPSCELDADGNLVTQPLSATNGFACDIEDIPGDLVLDG